MKVLHVTYGFLPDPPGGTELYVQGLVRGLARLGVHSTVAAPGVTDDAYAIDGIDVRRFACAPDRQTLDVLYGAGDLQASEAFARILEDMRPDVVHQHAWSPACSTDLVRRAKAAGVPVVFTYHTPTVSCQRGTLLQFGEEPCPGVLLDELCTACVLDSAGLNPVVRAGIGVVPIAVGESIGRRGLAGGMWTALRLPSLMIRRLDETRELFAMVDAWISLTPWVHRLLVDNGVPPDRIFASPHGVEGTRENGSPGRQRADGLRLAYFGRIEPAKGVNLLLEALRRIPSTTLELDIYGIRQTGANTEIIQAIERAALSDSRVRILDPVPHDRINATLRRYDAVVIPSQTFETGPLILLEACAARVPVIGSAIGGIADKVRHEETGLLVTPFDDPVAWAAVVRRCADEVSLLPRLRASVMPPREMADVAREMVIVYEGVTVGPADDGMASVRKRYEQA